MGEDGEDSLKKLGGEVDIPEVVSVCEETAGH